MRFGTEIVPSVPNPQVILRFLKQFHHGNHFMKIHWYMCLKKKVVKGAYDQEFVHCMYVQVRLPVVKLVKLNLEIYSIFVYRWRRGPKKRTPKVIYEMDPMMKMHWKPLFVSYHKWIFLNNCFTFFLFETML